MDETLLRKFQVVGIDISDFRPPPKRKRKFRRILDKYIRGEFSWR